MLAPDSWDAHARNDFSEPRLSYLPINRKALNSLIWDIWFSLANNNLLMFRLPAPCCKVLYNWLFPPPPWDSSLRVTWDNVSRAWRPKHSHRIKHNPPFFSFEYFKSTMLALFAVKGDAVLASQSAFWDRPLALGLHAATFTTEAGQCQEWPVFMTATSRTTAS